MSKRPETVRVDPAQRQFQPSPTAEIRRGAAVMVAICAVLLVLARLFVWHGQGTSEIAATFLFILTMFTIFGLVQLIFGASFNEVYANFFQTTGKQKFVYFAMIVLTVGLLWPFCHTLFPGIEDKIHR